MLRIILPACFCIQMLQNRLGSLFQRRKIILHKIPHALKIDHVVAMNENVSKTRQIAQTICGC